MTPKKAREWIAVTGQMAAIGLGVQHVIAYGPDSNLMLVSMLFAVVLGIFTLMRNGGGNAS